MNVLKISLPLILPLWISCNALQAQSTDSLLLEVHRLQNLRLTHYADEQRDSIFLLFEEAMQSWLTSPTSCAWRFDSTKLASLPVASEGKQLAYGFMNRLVTSSADERLRLYSWDELWGGSYHSYTNYLQYRTPDGTCKVMPFDTVPDNTEVGYYQVDTYELSASRSIYVLFGYGTYGGGKQHYAVRFFEFVAGEPRECLELYPNGEDLVIFCNRWQNPEVQFDPSTGTIMFKEFAYDRDVGFYRDEFTVREVLLRTE